MNDYLLSICIPTYNRCDVLKNCLDSIINDPEFYSGIEIIISDNNSTDNTEDLVTQYTKTFKNVKYYKNQTNLGGDKNILRSLELGNGLFLKLLNDYSVFLPGGLKFLLSCIKENIQEKPVIYVSRKLIKGKRKLYITNLDELLSIEKWGLSWIGNYGFWREDFSSFELKDRRIDTMFMQIDWLIRSFKAKKCIAYYSHPITKRDSFKNKQGDYNFFKVHTENFFIQFQELVDKGQLKSSSVEIAKKDVLYGLMYWVIVLQIDKKHFSYSSSGQFHILKQQFGQFPWFYPVVISGIFNAIKKLIKQEVLFPVFNKTMKPLISCFVNGKTTNYRYSDTDK